MTTRRIDRPSGRPRQPSVLLTHGAGGDITTSGLEALAGALAEAGHLVVRANLPYRDAGRRAPPRAERSVGPFAAIAADVAAEFGGSWVIGGRSYGGRVASMAVAERTVDAVGVLALAYPLHPPGKPERLRVDHWPAVAVPVLFVQGTRDPFGGPDELAPHLALLAAAPTVVAVEGADHSLATRRGNEASVVGGYAPAVAGWLASLV